MSIDTLPANIYNTLANHAGLTALISGRVFPLSADYGGTSPYVTYQQVAESQFNVLNNSGGGGKRQVRVQINSFATSHKVAFQVAEQVRVAMRDATLFSSSYQLSIDMYEPDTKLYSVKTDYSVMTS